MRRLTAVVSLVAIVVGGMLSYSFLDFEAGAFIAIGALFAWALLVLLGLLPGASGPGD